MASPTLKPNAAIEQVKRDLAVQLAEIEQDWYATVPPEWHVAIREAATRSLGQSDGTVKVHNWQKATIEENDVVFIDGKKIVREE